jgi:hypothetical protein
VLDCSIRLWGCGPYGRAPPGSPVDDFLEEERTPFCQFPKFRYLRRHGGLLLTQLS